MVRTGTFEEFFKLDGGASLEEQNGDLIGDIAILVECRNGDLLVGDRIKLQVRRYAPDGRLLAVFGRFGEGPFEFRGLGAAVEMPDGRVVATDPRLGRVTIFSGDLRPDTLFLLRPAPRGTAIAMGDAMVLASVAGPRATAFTSFDSTWEPEWTIPAPSPGTMQQFPYWDSFASVLAGATSELLLTAYSLRYPVYVHGRGGGLIDSLSSAPRAFRPASRVPRGAFAGPDGLHRQDAWLASFDIISRLVVVGDSLLVVVHGVLRRTATSPAATEDRTVDIYHLPSRAKLAESVRLPGGSRVLGGGRSLYVLTAQPPERWTITRATFVGASSRADGGRSTP